MVGVGALTVNKAIKGDKDYLGLSTWPVVFGIQQIIEGIVWTGINRGDGGLVKRASLAFLFFAFMVWPILFPYGVLRISRHQKHFKKILYIFLLGIILGTLSYIPLLIGSTQFTTTVVGCSIQYLSDRSFAYKGILTAVYLAVVTLPLFLNKIKKVRIYGVLFTLSIIITFAVKAKTFFSVWCFFAALLSIGIYFVIPSKEKSFQAETKPI